jgi:trehalose 6-phosphate synthase
MTRLNGNDIFRRLQPNPCGIWTEERLHTWVNAFLGDARIVVVSNRPPFTHERLADGSVIERRSAGGLVTALEPIVRACSGVWVAQGADGAERAAVDRRDGDAGRDGRPYRLRRVRVEEREQQGYYYGFANEALWPLCHRVHVQPMFRRSDFNMYRAVNERFAAVVCEEAAGEAPVVLVQDYHFALAPRFIRDRLPLSTVVTFWHIPWPHPRGFEICPWAAELLKGLLGSTIAGFQTPADCANFLDTVAATLDADIDRKRGLIEYEGHTTAVRAYPVSIAYPSRCADFSPSADSCLDTTRRELQIDSDVRIGLGVDRMDYTKGINEKFLAVERLLELRPEFRRRFTFVQVAEPSRTHLHAYQECRSRLEATADRVNRRFGDDRWQPIVLLQRHHEPAEVYRLFRAADVCFVNSLHDGQNLVAKEFVSARDDERGVLVLSRFAGAAQQLPDALIVNPYAIDDCASTLADALTMPVDEQVHRLRRMRSTVATYNTYWWGARMLQDAAQVRRPAPGLDAAADIDIAATA